MPAYTATYSREQRQALYRAVLGDGMNVTQALRAAAAGELPDLDVESQRQLGAMAYAYACKLIRDERDERDGVQRARSQPETVARDTAVALLRRAQADALKIANDRQKSTMDADAAAKTLKVSRDALALLDALDARKGKGKDAPGSSSAPQRPPTIAQRIAAQAKTAAGNAPPHNEASGDSTRAARASEPDSDTDNQDGGAVRSSAGASGPAAGLELAGA